MTYILEGVVEAFKLLLSFDKEIYSIIFLSLFVSGTSTIIGVLIGVPVGLLTSLKKFKFKRIYAKFLNTSMSIPPVVLGLLVSLLLSRRGPLSDLKLLYTPTAMIIAQTFLVTPIITGIIFNNTKKSGKRIKNVCLTLGGNKRDILFLLVRETKIDMFIALVTGLGRAISEVGAVMLVGGNIKGNTRVMTTYISMNNGMGDYPASIAMGIVLLAISFTINSLLYKYVQGDTDEY